MRFDNVWRVEFFAEDDGSTHLRVRLWRGERQLDEITAELHAAGWTDIDEGRDALGHWSDFRFPGPRQQAVRAMEQMCGVRAVALAMAPRLEFTDADLDRMADEVETRCEARSWPRKVNPHDD